MKNFFFVLAFCTLFIDTFAYAQLPQTISYQGYLSTVGGLPAHDSSYTLTFKLYTVASGGSAIWTEAHSNVATAKGTFNVILGSVTPLTGVDFNQQLYVGVTKGSDLEFSPRSQLTSSPSSLAPWAIKDTNISYTNGNVGIGTTSPTALLHLSNGTYDTKFDGNSILFTRNDGPAYIDAINVGGRIDFVTNGRVAGDGNSNLVLQTDQSSYFNGKVGIGTNSPASLLHVGPGGGGFASDLLTVSGSGNTGISVRSGSSASDATAIRFYRGGTQIGFLSAENGNVLKFYNTSTLSGIAIDPSGHVGIGTSSPGTSLEVIAPANATGAVVISASNTPSNSVAAVNAIAVGANAGTNVGLLGNAQNAAVNYGVEGWAVGGTTNYGGYFTGDLVYTGSLIHSSDMKFKENIQSYSGSLSQLMSLMPRTFNYKSGLEYNRFSFSPGKHYGFIAQEVEKVFPDLVVTAVQPAERDSKGQPKGEPMKYKAMKSMELIPILVSAIQEQQKLIEQLQAKVARLEKK